MLTLALSAAIAMVAAGMLLNMARMLRGPAPADRILALDTLSINAIALVMLVGMLLAATVQFEVALLIAMTGFVATAALCRYLLGGGVID